MANTPGYAVALKYANESLRFLKKRLGLGNRVFRGYDINSTYDQGDTLRIRRPMTFTATAAPATATALVPDNIALALSNWFEVKFEVTDKEYAQAFAGYVPSHMETAAYAVADKIDQTIAALAVTVPHSFGEPLSTGTVSTVAGVLAVQRKLFDNLCPIVDIPNMHFMIGGQEQADLLALAAFSGYNVGGDPSVSTQRTGEIGLRYGFNFFANQNRTSTAYANVSDFAGATTAIVAKGATSMPVGSLGAAEVYKKGSIIKMTSGTDIGSEYAVTADVTMSGGAGTFVINPPARNAMGSGDTFSISTTQGEATPTQDNVTRNQNLAFHRDWAALAMARLPDFSDQSNPGLGASIASVQDPVTGLALRARTFYVGDSSKMVCALDALWGVAELNPEMACRYEITAA